PVDDLRIGMYVSELDRTELTPAAFRGFRVHTQTQIDKLKRYCRHVYIDVPERLPYPGSHRPAAGKWPTPRSFTTEEEKKLQFEILKLGATPSAAAQKYQDQTTIEQETGTLRPAYDALKVFVRKTMQNIRQGGGFDSDDVKKVV
ncbi:MAG: DUF3391 domain-containing protein, partial [Gammaproteobacteria bacterium]|nr:DUF3391 domain-containing protein [Gammaproteobacteria bacterium]